MEKRRNETSYNVEFRVRSRASLVRKSIKCSSKQMNGSYVKVYLPTVQLLLYLLGCLMQFVRSDFRKIKVERSFLFFFCSPPFFFLDISLYFIFSFPNDFNGGNTLRAISRLTLLIRLKISK